MWQLTDEDGLLSNTIYNMLQDEKGYVWAGTSNGLCRYDGVNFKSYPIPQYNDSEILRLRQDALDRLWTVNLSGQIACIDKNGAPPKVFFEEKQALDLNFRDSTLWIIFKDDKEANKGKIFGIARIGMDSDGYPTSTYIYPERFFRLNFTISDRKTNPLKLSGYQESSDKKIYIIDPDPKSESIKRTFYFENASGSYIHIDEGKFYFIHSKKNQLAEVNKEGDINLIHDLNPISEYNTFSIFDNHYLFLTQNGVYYKSKKKEAPILHWLKNLTANAVMKDKEDNYWISTDGRGIFIIPSLEINHYSTFSGELPNNNVYSIFHDKTKKNIQVGLDNGKILTIENGKVIQQIDLPISGRILEIIQIKNTFFYFADTGLYRKTEDGTIRLVNDLAGKRAIKDNNDRVLIGTGIGLAVYNVIDILSDAEILEDYQKKYIKDKRIYGLHQDKKGTVWIGSTKGLFTWRDSIFSPFTENGTQRKYSVSSIVENSDQRLWVGTSGEGIFSIQSDSVGNRINLANGLSSNNCKSLTTDDNKLWVGTNKGINIVDLKTMDIRQIDKHDGLPSNEISEITIVDSMVWVGTSKGLVSFSKNLRKDNPTPPPVHITGLKVEDKNISLTETISLSHEHNNLQFDYIGFGYSTQGDLKYKYKLEGADLDWTYTSGTQVNYPQLKPGEYTFSVIGINEDNVESLAPAKINIYIAVPFWDTHLFKLFFGISFIALISSIYLWLSKQKELKQKEAQDFQNTVNELQMQALQTQVNPHFIFNALNAIQQFQVSNEREQAIDYLTQFAHLIRMIFEHSKEKVITFNQEIEFLNLYLEMEKLRFKDKVEIDLRISPELKASQQLINVPPLLIQPIIENAFKHGLFHKGKNGKLLVDFKKKDNFLICTVEDNGVGRVEAEKRNINRNKNYESSGLSTSEKRLQIYNNTENDPKKPVNSNIKIVDLFDSNGKAAGTRFELAIRI